MEINLALYKVIHLPNGNILLRLRRDIDETPYNLILTDLSFYIACRKNIGKINIYEPTNLTQKILNIIMNETTHLTSFDHFLDKINWIQDNLTTTERNTVNEKNIYNNIQLTIVGYTLLVKKNIDYYCKNNKTKIKKSTWAYLFVKIIAELSGHDYSFGEEFFLLKLLHQYFPNMKWDYKQIYIIETNNDLGMCAEKGEKYHLVVSQLRSGDKKAFEGKEIEFFPTSFNIKKMNISQETFACIQQDIDEYGVSWKNYDPIDINY